jgi:hypothetical protein
VRPASRAALCAAVTLALAFVPAGCGVRRFLGFGGDGTLLVRHHEPDPQQIWLGGDLLGAADSGGVVCFRGTRTGTMRLEARNSDESLTRATSIVLPPEQARLWDIDHDQVLDGRAFLGSCP